MASCRRPAVNKQPKGTFTNGVNANDTKFKGRSGVIVPNRVFVGGICPTATENDLANLFSKYGSVKAIKIVFDQNGSSKGYGFVTFEKAEDVVRLQNDAKNLTFNDRRLNIAPAVMKNPPFVGRFTEYVLPLSSNMYVPYSYQDGAPIYANNGYPSHITVMPTVDHAFYSSNYASPTPYQGAALFYPVSANGSPVLVGPQPYSTYQSIPSNNSNYIYSSSSSLTTSPTNSSGKTAAPLNTPSTTSDIHGSHGPPILAAAMPPNMSTMPPPPVPFPLSPPPQYYNGNMMPSYSGDVYYSMAHGGCYPIVMNGQESYIPYYEVGESCNHNVTPEDANYELQNYAHNTVGQSYAIESSGKDINPVSGNNASNGTIHNGECKQSMQTVPPPTSEHHPEPSYSVENNTNALPPPQTSNPMPTQSSVAATTNYNNQPSYIQHRSAIVYPNGPMPQPNIYFNSVYMADATTSSLGQCPYSKNLSDQYVSDHLPKRDAKYPPKKYAPSPNKDAPPNIPKFPFFINNNYPGFVNRNVKDKDFNKNGRTGETKSSPRPPRNNAANNMPPKPRVFHNQNQYGGPVRPPRNDRNGHVMSNMQNARPGAVIPSRQNSYDQSQFNSYEYQNNYQAYHYSKPGSHEGHRRYGQNPNGNYWAKCEKGNAGGHDGYSKNSVDERSRKYASAEDAVPAHSERSPQTEQNGNAQQRPSSATSQQQQVCAEMQKLSL